MPPNENLSLTGLVVSVGGLAERLVMSASGAFFRQLEEMKSAERSEVCQDIVRILEDNHRTDRYTIAAD